MLHDLLRTKVDPSRTHSLKFRVRGRDARDGSHNLWRECADSDDLQSSGHPVAEYIHILGRPCAEPLQCESGSTADDPLDRSCVLEQERVMQLPEQGIEIV
jgi:hypothetical protein